MPTSMALIFLGSALLLVGIIWFTWYDWSRWSLPPVSRRILGTVFCSAWVLLLATRSLAAAVLSSDSRRSYSSSLEILDPLLPVSAWVCLALGIWLLGERKAPANVVAPPSDDSPTTRSL